MPTARPPVKLFSRTCTLGRCSGLLVLGKKSGSVMGAEACYSFRRSWRKTALRRRLVGRGQKGIGHKEEYHGFVAEPEPQKPGEVGPRIGGAAGRFRAPGARA